MNKRIAELSEKVRTEECQLIEAEYRENLEDLRLIAAKEYSNALMGKLSSKPTVLMIKPDLFHFGRGGCSL